MSGKDTTSAAIAAIAIILGFGFLFYIIPTVTLWLANTYSVWLAAAFDVAAVLALLPGLLAQGAPPAAGLTAQSDGNRACPKILHLAFSCTFFRRNSK